MVKLYVRVRVCFVVMVTVRIEIRVDVRVEVIKLSGTG